MRHSASKAELGFGPGRFRGPAGERVVGLHGWRQGERKGATSKAVRDAESSGGCGVGARQAALHPGAPLEPGWLRLKSGLAQVVFYSGARVVIEGPTDLELISPSETSCRAGRLTAEVPPQAKGFRVGTPEMNVTDLGTAFGIQVGAQRTELHVFKGSVDFQPQGGGGKQNLLAGAGAITERSQGTRRSPPSRSHSRRCLTSNRNQPPRRYCARAMAGGEPQVKPGPALLVHFNFDQEEPSSWRLHNGSMGSEPCLTPPSSVANGLKAGGRTNRHLSLGA